MKSTDDVKTFYKGAAIETNPAADRAVLTDALQAGRLTQRKPLARNAPGIGRFLMESRITKLTAAGLVIAATIIGVSHFNGTVVEAVEFSEITEAMGKVPWMRESAVAEGPGVTGTTELWIGFDAKVQGGRISDGTVSFCRLREHEMAEYDPNSNTVTLRYAREDDFSPSMSSPVLMLESMEKMLEEHGAEIVARMGDYRGRKVQVQEISLGNPHEGISRYTARLYVDPQSKLLYAMESKTVDGNGVAVSSTEATYDYPRTGPRDIYDLGVPRDARIVDHMPARDLRRVLERYRQIRGEATRQYIAVIAHNTAVNITDAVNMIDVEYKSGRKHRQERHSVFDAGQTFEDAHDQAWAISKQRIGSTFESILAWSRGRGTERGKFSMTIHLYDGQYDCSIRRDPENGWGRRTRHYRPDGSMAPENALGDLAWPHISANARIIEDEYATEHKLICLERLYSGHVYNRTASLPMRFLYYLDPAWGYLCRRRVIERRPDAEWQQDKDWLVGIDPKDVTDGSISVHEIIEAFQAPNGHWYPKVITVQSTGIRKDYRQIPVKTHTSKRVYLDLSAEFPEGIFDIDKLPGR